MNKKQNIKITIENRDTGEVVQVLDKNLSACLIIGVGNDEQDVNTPEYLSHAQASTMFIGDPISSALLIARLTDLIEAVKQKLGEAFMADARKLEALLSYHSTFKYEDKSE